MPFQAVAYGWRQELGNPLKKLIFLWLCNEADASGIVDLDMPRLAMFAEVSEASVRRAIQEICDCPCGQVSLIAPDFSACKILLPVRRNAWDNDGLFVPIRRSSIPASVRARVEEKSGGACFACRSRVSLQLDHIIPLAEGGEDHEDNLQLLCADCNGRKRARLGWVRGA